MSLMPSTKKKHYIASIIVSAKFFFRNRCKSTKLNTFISVNILSKSMLQKGHFISYIYVRGELWLKFFPLLIEKGGNHIYYYKECNTFGNKIILR